MRLPGQNACFSQCCLPPKTQENGGAGRGPAQRSKRGLGEAQNSLTTVTQDNGPGRCAVPVPESFLLRCFPGKGMCADFSAQSVG